MSNYEYNLKSKQCNIILLETLHVLKINANISINKIKTIANNVSENILIALVVLHAIRIK